MAGNLNSSRSYLITAVHAEDQLLEGRDKDLQWAIICIHLYLPLIVFSVKAIAIKDKDKSLDIMRRPQKFENSTSLF